MAEEEHKKTGQPGEAYLACVVDHHALVNKEEAFPDVYLHVDEKSILTAHYYVLKCTPTRSPSLSQFNGLDFAPLAFARRL